MYHLEVNFSVESINVLSCNLDPIWLIASVEEGGLMGITQQLDQCHSLGMNVQQPQQHMTSEMTVPPSNNLLYQTSPTNPFQSTRCKEKDFPI